MLFVFSTCRELIRTLPMMLHDPTHPEDLDTDPYRTREQQAEFDNARSPWLVAKAFRFNDDKRPG